MIPGKNPASATPGIGGFEAVNGRRLGEFAPDSPLEGAGFEPSVPRLG